MVLSRKFAVLVPTTSNQGLEMKKLIVMTCAILTFVPAWADEGHGASSPNTEEESTSHAPYEDRESTVTGLTLAQYASSDGLYANQSELRINMVDINGADVSGLDATQAATINGGSHYDSHVEVNAIRLYGGSVGSSSIKQSATFNNAILRSSTVQLNKLYIR